MAIRNGLKRMRTPVILGVLIVSTLSAIAFVGKSLASWHCQGPKRNTGGCRSCDLGSRMRISTYPLLAMNIAKG
jgi:hypothetical protein